MAIPSTKSLSPPPLHAPMPPPIKGGPRGAGGELGDPRGQPPLDQAPSPPPSCGGLWARHRSLLGGFFIRMS
jgi:hypothetical protein